MVASYSANRLLFALDQARQQLSSIDDSINVAVRKVADRALWWILVMDMMPGDDFFADKDA